jgi:hypothetical protein
MRASGQEPGHSRVDPAKSGGAAHVRFRRNGHVAAAWIGRADYSRLIMTFLNLIVPALY